MLTLVSMESSHLVIFSTSGKFITKFIIYFTIPVVWEMLIFSGLQFKCLKHPIRIPLNDTTGSVSLWTVCCTLTALSPCTLTPTQSRLYVEGFLQQNKYEVGLQYYGALFSDTEKRYCFPCSSVMII